MADQADGPAAGRATTAEGRAPKIRRAGWNVVDQGLSALTNVVMSFVVARNVDAAGFGAFAVAFLVFSLVIGVQRALVGTPMSMRYSHEDADQQRRTIRPALGTALAIALLVSAGALVVGIAVGGVLGPTLVALAVVLPFLVLQDTCRMAFFAWSRPQHATLNDAVWAFVQFALVGAVIVAGRSTPATMVLCWGLGAAVAAVVGMVQLHGGPHPRGVGTWVRANRDLVGYLLVEYLLGVGAFQGGILVIGGLLGVSDIGALRAAQVLVGPIGIVSTAATTFGIPEVSRRSSLPRHTVRIASLTSTMLVAITLLYAGLLLLIPTSLGTALLGDTWTGASAVLLPVAMASAVAGGKLGPVIFMYGLGLARKTIRLVTVLAVSAVTFMAVGAHRADAVGLAWGMCLAQAVVMPLWFLQLRAVVRAGWVPTHGRLPDGADDGAGPDPLGLGSDQEWPGAWADLAEEGPTAPTARTEGPTP